MIIQNNLIAMNAKRQFNITRAQRTLSSEKLSSGFRINRSADDAAGLAISEKMRRQIRGLTQASINAQDGISMVQTAEGALNEVHDMLHRLNELCVKAANDTMSVSDRDSVQSEISLLKDEIDHIGESTVFNEIKLLSGLPQPRAVAVDPGIRVNGASGTVNQATSSTDASYVLNNLNNGAVVSIVDPQVHYYKVATQNDIDAYNKDWADYYQEKAKYEADMAIYRSRLAEYNSAWEEYNRKVAEDPTYSGDPPSLENPRRPDPLRAEPLKRDGSSYNKAQLAKINVVKEKIENSLISTNLSANSEIADSVSANYDANSSNGTFGLHFYGPLPVSLQVGSEKGQILEFSIGVVSAGSLRINNIDVSGESSEGALNGIDKVKEAIERLSKNRSDLGAVQNRLEHTIKNLDNVVENTTYAESAIRDTDMAKEAMNNAMMNILEQAGAAMITQANQIGETVLKLIQ